MKSMDFPLAFAILGTAWDLLMRGEGIELPREAQVLEAQRSETLGLSRRGWR